MSADSVNTIDRAANLIAAAPLLRTAMLLGIPLLLTPARVMAVFLVPLFLLLLGRYTSAGLGALVLFLVIAFVAFGVSQERLWLNLMIALLLLLPALLLLCLGDSISKSLDRVALNSALALMGNILICNGVIGLFQYAITRHDDAAIGFYGRSGLNIHGLATLYIAAAIYFFNRGKDFANRTKCVAMVVFFISCTYGMGLVAAILALSGAALLSFKNKSLAITTVLTVFFLTAGILYLVNPIAFTYNIDNLQLIVGGAAELLAQNDSDLVPRKLLVWANYAQLASHDPSTIIAGVGPGTFNSRAAFMLNGDYSSIQILPTSMSWLHYSYVMPLWSSDVLWREFQDGSANQPFSSTLALIAEYGVAALVVLAAATLRLRSRLLIGPWTQARRFSLNFLLLYFAGLCLVDNLLEYAEVMLPLFLVLFWLRLPAMSGTNR